MTALGGQQSTNSANLNNNITYSDISDRRLIYHLSYVIMKPKPDTNRLLPRSESSVPFSKAIAFLAAVNHSNKAKERLTGWWYTYPSEKYESQWEG